MDVAEDLAKYTTGVRIDCNKLIDSFIATESLRYKEFSKLWREKKMSLIYYGREDYRDLQDFTGRVLHMVKSLWLNCEKDNIHLQVAGFYSLYAFYMKQPLKSTSPIKIRMTQEEWSKCIAFVKFLKDNEHWDAYYIFYKLVQENSFHYVISSLAVHPGSRSIYGDDSIRNLKLKPENRLRRFTNDNFFQLLTNQHEAYENIKRNVVGEELQLTDPNLVNSIKRLSNYDCEITKMSEGSPTSNALPVDLGERRKTLKMKQFSDKI